MNHWLALVIAIVAEVIGTTALKASNEFTRFWPSLIVICGYGTAFYCMSISMRVLHVGVMYAIWFGMGIVLVSLLSWFVYKQSLDVAALVGMIFIITGVVIINVFSKMVSH
jgi:small multidrug resistance pump